ncbi:MAG: ATP-binding protein, partial [bacterium]
MTEEELHRALDPFYTTKKRKRVGLGLPMLNRTAQQCGGSLEMQSRPGSGTRVKAIFMLNHIDCPPLGDINETLRVIVAGNSGVDFDIKYIADGEVEYFSTRKEQAVVAEIPLRKPIMPARQA